MKSKLTKILVISLTISLIAGLTGSFALAANKELTPYEWFQMKPKDKLKYKKVTVRVFTNSEERLLLEKDQIPGPLTLRERVHTGDASTPITWYSQTLFETLHPKVKIEYVSMGSYGQQAEQFYRTKILAGEGPAFYESGLAGGNMSYVINQGLAADITDLVKTLPFYKKIKEEYWLVWSPCWRDNRCYGIVAGGGIGGDTMIAYRKDWFKEAGIFDENGEPGPSYNWTITDFRKICKKFTDPKMKRWGFAYGPSDRWGPIFQFVYPLAFAFGSIHFEDPLAMPDKSGKYTWRAKPDPALGEALVFMHDLMFKDKSLLSGVEKQQIYGSWEDFVASRVAMCFFPWSQAASRVLETPYLISSTVPAKELVGLNVVPRGPYGMRPNTDLGSVGGGGLVFNPLLSKEELKAAFDWYVWENYGRGKELQLEMAWDKNKILGSGWGWTIIGSYNQVHLANVQLPAGMPSIDELIPSTLSKPIQRLLKVPMQRFDSQFHLAPAISRGEKSTIMTGLFQAAISDPNFDAQVEMKKTCDKLNSVIYTIKATKEDRENFKKYADALVSFYEEYYPEYTKTERYKEEIARFKF